MSILFAIKAILDHKQMREQTRKVINDSVGKGWFSNRSMLDEVVLMKYILLRPLRERKMKLCLLVSLADSLGEQFGPRSEIVSMIRKYHKHKQQPTPWHREEEPLNHHETPGRQIKQSNQLSLFVFWYKYMRFHEMSQLNWLSTQNRKKLNLRILF